MALLVVLKLKHVWPFWAPRLCKYQAFAPIGIPLINATLILAGGTLVFIAASLLWLQLTGLPSKTSSIGTSAGRNFYLAGLGYLLVGIIVGTGLWLGWGQALNIAVAH